MDDTRTVTRVQLTLDRDYQFMAEFPDSPAVRSIRVDEAPPLGEGQGPNPAALLTAAIGNCLAASLLFGFRIPPPNNNSTTPTSVEGQQ